MSYWEFILVLFCSEQKEDKTIIFSIKKLVILNPISMLIMLKWVSDSIFSHLYLLCNTVCDPVLVWITSLIQIVRGVYNSLPPQLKLCSYSYLCQRFSTKHHTYNFLHLDIIRKVCIFLIVPIILVGDGKGIKHLRL